MALFVACALTLSCAKKKQADQASPSARHQAAARTAGGLEGRPAQGFALKALDGRPVSLADLKGKTVLIDFWATWCPPCRRAMPHIQKIHEDYQDQGLVVLAISSEPPEKPRAFLEENGYTFTTLSDPGGKTGRAYGVRGIPTTLIVDIDGIVSTHTVGYKSEEELRAALAKVGLTK